MKDMKGLACAILILGAMVAHAQESAADLRARAAAEPDPIRRAKLEVRLAGVQFDGARRKYVEGYPEDGQKLLEEMLATVNQTEERLLGTGRDSRKRPSGFKELELQVRRLVRLIRDLSKSLPVEERPPADRVAGRMEEIGDDLLHGIMRVQKKERKP